MFQRSVFGAESEKIGLKIGATRATEVKHRKTETTMPRTGDTYSKIGLLARRRYVFEMLLLERRCAFAVAKIFRSRFLAKVCTPSVMSS